MRMYALNVDLPNPWIVMHKVVIDTLHNKLWICSQIHGLSAWYLAQSMD